MTSISWVTRTRRLRADRAKAWTRERLSSVCPMLPPFWRKDTRLGG